jgi:ribosomal protein L3 glutamine methyltransferase
MKPTRAPRRAGAAKDAHAPRRSPVTVRDHVRAAAARLVAADLAFAHGTTDPVAEAAFLVCAALDLPPDRFDAVAGRRVTAPARARIDALVAARIATRKPAAYLVGRAYMRGIAFHVDERVIVPRSYLGEILDDAMLFGDGGTLRAGPVVRVLDLCTGSGCLAILAALRFPDARVDAVDISADALAVAAQNIAAHGLGGRITLHRGDLFDPVRRARYDLILANPPYVDAPGMASLPPECRHEPALALDGGADGIAVVRRIIDNAHSHLTRDAGLLCEVGRTRLILEACYPDTGFVWLDSEESSGEVFWLAAGALPSGRGTT